MTTDCRIQNPDDAWMQLALDLAKESVFRTSPNPRVGCVLVGTDGVVIGKGSTQAAGQAHAEVMALQDAKTRGFSTKGATAYVTLEPCSHHGKTGPCCEALISAGIGRVVASMQDPNPLVGGNGFARLRNAGIEVCVGPGAHDSRELNLGFLSRILRRRPWVRLKIAASADGMTALHNGESQWITAPESRLDGHYWRARACAVLTGIGTILQDDPQLNVRGIDTARQPKLVIADSTLQTPLDGALWQEARQIWIYGAHAPQSQIDALKQRGASVNLLTHESGISTSQINRVNLPALIQDLAEREINELHVEAGYTLSGALLEAGLVDELLIYTAPKLLGPGKNMFAMAERTSLSQSIQMQFTDVRLLGQDLRLLARIEGSDQF